MNHDHIFLNKMEILCRIGTTSDERAFPQVVWVTVRCYLALSKAGASDDLRDTADYAKIVDDIRLLTSNRTFNLAESLAQAIAEKALLQPLIQAAEVTIEKKVFNGIESVGAFIRREK